MSVNSASDSKKNNRKNLHAGHRERMRKRFLEHGFDDFCDHEILEFLLFYVHKRADTNELGHTLINTFGSLKGVMHADYEDLMKIDGIGKQGAVFLKMLPQLIKAYERSDVKPCTLTTHEERSLFFTKMLRMEQEEVVLLACMDDNMDLLRCNEVGRGSPNRVKINLRKVMLHVLRSKATCVLIAHNHPMGKAVASYEDVQTTINVRRFLKDMGVNLLDHYIIADGTALSMYKSGAYNPI